MHPLTHYRHGSSKLRQRRPSFKRPFTHTVTWRTLNGNRCGPVSFGELNAFRYDIAPWVRRREEQSCNHRRKRAIPKRSTVVFLKSSRRHGTSTLTPHNATRRVLSSSPRPYLDFCGCFSHRDLRTESVSFGLASTRSSLFGKNYWGDSNKSRVFEMRPQFFLILLQSCFLESG